METQTCTSCNLEKDADQFNVRRDGILYKWCIECCDRADEIRVSMRKPFYKAEEIQAMREVTKKLKKLTDAQVVEAKKRRLANEPVKVIAADYNVSTSVIYKVTNRGYRV